MVQLENVSTFLGGSELQLKKIYIHLFTLKTNYIRILRSF